MATRRKIRQAAVQFLYSVDLEGGDDPTAMREPFWQILGESDYRTLLVAMFKVLRHLQHSRHTRFRTFYRRLPEALAAMQVVPEMQQRLDQLRCIADLESEWEQAMEQIDKIQLDTEAVVLIPQLQGHIEQIFELNRKLLRARREFSTVLDEFPHFRGRLEPILGSIERLNRISQRVELLADPDVPPQQPELKRIHDSKMELETLRRETDAMTDAVLAHRTEVDAVLSGTIENYSPTRVDPVDRAILRLATWELRFATDIPTAVVINEAIELARKFGTSDSPRFVNGVLDKIAQTRGE